MSTRFEFFEAKRTRPTLWDALQTEEDADEQIEPGTYSLVLGGDTSAAFVGTVDELRALVERITRELDATEPALPELPDPDDSADEQEATCPYVWTQADADAVIAANAEYVAKMRAMHGEDARLSLQPVPVPGEVCGADLMVWDDQPMVGYLYSQGGRWIVGPQKSGDGGGDCEVNCSNMHYWAVPDIDEWQ